MSNYALLTNERLYSVVESTFGTVPAITGANACRFTRFAPDPIADINRRNDKTGSRSEVEFIKGRRHGTWEVVMDLAGSGTAGTVPDCDPFFQTCFGQAPTVSPGTSVAYAISDAFKTISIFAYKNNPTTLNHWICVGALGRTLRIGFGGNTAVLTVSGTCIWPLSSDYFSSASTTEKGGLGTFPAEPGTQTYNGVPIVGFTGTATWGGNVIAEIQDGTFILDTATEQPLNQFGSYYAVGNIGGRRAVSVDFRAFDGDSTGIQNLRNKAMSQTPITVNMVMGTVAGNILTVAIPNLMLSSPRSGESDLRFDLSFNASRAYASAFTAKDEITMTWT